MFNALILSQTDNTTQTKITSLDESALPDGNVTIAIEYSSLNYKDALAVTGRSKIISQFPMVPGIDFSGTVIQSTDSRYQTGDKVILTSWGVGVSHWGGFAEKACVNADWLTPLPSKLTTNQAMCIGTAGLTAMLCVQALQHANVSPSSGKILVTGASGGVGSIAVALLAQLGYKVTASSGKAYKNETILKSLGAEEIISRQELEEPAKPLEQQKWAGVIDTVGGSILAKALSQINYGGVAAICGLTGGFKLATTVMPFILRGVSLFGIDSVYCPYEKRLQAWNQLAKLLPKNYYHQIVTTIGLDQIPEYANKLLDGEITGRIIVKIAN